MVDQTPNIPQEQEPFIPPSYMLILAGLGLLVALGVALTQPSFNVVGWGALGIAALSLIAWVFMAPEQARAVLTGRTARYGSTAVLVTFIFLVALVAIYVAVSWAEIRIDLTERDQFSLTPESRQAIAAIGAAPNLPAIKLLAFYSANQAGRRDQDSLLFKDYAETSRGKISYEFIDPDRNPAQVQLYETTLDTRISGGQIIVAALQDDGQPDANNAEVVSFFSQDELTNAILKASASGDFRAYVLNVDDGLSLSDISVLQNDMQNLFDWTIEEVSLFQLTSPSSEIKLDDPAVDGTVLIIPGGSSPLSDDELQFISNYLNDGGDLVILAGPSVTDNTSLAVAENLSTYLYDNFGVRFRNDVILDAQFSVQGTPLLPVASTFDTVNFITSSFPSNQVGAVFEVPHSIEIAPTLPQNITLSELIKTSDVSYSKTDINAVLNNEITQTDSDPKGPFVVGAAVENSQTGAKIVLYGSPTIFQNLSGQGIVNTLIARLTLAWTTNFNDFFNQVNIQSEFRPQDAPVFATDQVIRNITLVSIFVVPFSVLAIGLLVWWNNRERAATVPGKEA